jgi:hypothetical protein
LDFPEFLDLGQTFLTLVNMFRIILVLIAVVFTASMGLVVFGEVRTFPSGSLERPLGDMLPRAADFGWQERDLPLGPTESVIDRSERLLRFDDFVFREFRRGSQYFTVYVAYWEPGKMPRRLVNMHNPDLCWILGGWVCTYRVRGKPLQVGDVVLVPAQFGTYEMRGHEMHTYFWHMVDGEPYEHQGLSVGRQVRNFLLTPFTGNFTAKSEQFFIRVTSSEPIDFILREEMAEAVFKSLADSGLVREKRG